MKKLIVLPGRMDSPFFLNELGFLKKTFDQITVVSYPVPEEKIPGIKEEYGVACHIINNKKNRAKTAVKLFQWLKNPDVKQEIRENFSMTFNGFSRMAYIVLYGIFALQA